MKYKKINILGTEYKISEKNRIDDEILNDADGYCDKTTKEIIVCKNMDGGLKDMDWYKKKVLRHEIIHAFLYESGLQENFMHPNYGHDETYLDWFATQSPKIFKVYKDLNIL